MNPEAVPESLSIPLGKLVELGVEHWRIATWLASSPAAGSAGTARHALRRMEDFLRQCELEVRHLDGHPFDAGLAAQVVHSEEDPGLPKGMIVISETVSPLVLWRGQVVREAEIVTRRGTGP